MKNIQLYAVVAPGFPQRGARVLIYSTIFPHGGANVLNSGAVTVADIRGAMGCSPSNNGKPKSI